MLAPMTDAGALRVYTDGACSGNPGPGGWAWASSADHNASGGESATTNNRMELTAVLRAIEDNPGPLTVVMDSTYVKNGLERWVHNWVRNGWRTRDGKDVKNRDLWEELVAVLADRRREVEFEWVKGHSGDRMNDLVDELAVVQRDLHRGSVGTGASGGSGGADGTSRSAGGARLADLPPDEQRAERRRRDPRIPPGHLMLVVGHGPDELGGWEENPLSARIRDQLTEMFEGHRRIEPDLVVVTGMRPGAELLAAEAAVRADVPYAAVAAFPDQHSRLSTGVRARIDDLTGRAAHEVRLEKKVPADKDAFVKAMRRRDAWLTAAADEAILVWDEQDNRYDRLYADLDRRLGAALTVVRP